MAIAVPTARELHLMNRLGCGYSRSTFAQLRAAGGALPWFERQLAPAGIPESDIAKALPGWFPTLYETPQRKAERNESGSRGGWQYARDLANLSMLRRVYSQRQVLETMVEFWSDHLHVPAQAGIAWIQRRDYDDVVRANALGTFEDLLVACTLHPSMLVYLDNWKSVQGAPNENHGRELLELHTVGPGTGYTEAMVRDSSKILSGWTVDETTYRAYYDPDRHTTGPVSVLGFTSANGSSDGRAVTRAYLHHLAQHPATARRVVHRMAQRFVADTPSEALLDRLVQVWLDTGSDIKAVLRALVASDEFWASAGMKVRTPIEDAVATVRVLQITALRPTQERSFARIIVQAPHSQLPYHWPRPDGRPEDNASWCSPSRMLASMRMHWGLSAGWFATADVRYRRRRSWLPRRRMRLSGFVDHLSRLVLGRPADPRLVRAVAQATGRSPREVVTADHPVLSHMFPRVMAVLLDSPTHLVR